MSEDTYKGESLQKKHARYLTHLLAQAWTNESKYRGNFERGMHAFLLSREGGDIGVLRSLGVPFDNMVGLDRSEDAIHSCVEKWGWAKTADSEGTTPHFVLCNDADVEFAGICACLDSHKDPTFVRREMSTGRIVDPNNPGGCPEEAATGSCWTKRWASRSGFPYISSAFWDFCGHLDKLTIQAIADTWARLSIGSVFSVAVLKGREKRQTTHRSVIAPFANRKMRRAQRAILGEGNAILSSMMRGATPWNVAEVIAAFEAEHGRKPALARWRLVRDVLVMADLFHTSVPEPISIIEYQSRTKKSGGVPMLIVSFAKRWRKDAADVFWEPIRIRLSDRVSLKWRNAILAERTNEDAALILNVPRATASAWKAHATRGTYDKSEAAE